MTKNQGEAMNTADVNISQTDLRKLLAAASGDAALLHIFLKAGNAPEEACEKLNITQSRLSCALATLRQLGLYGQEKKLIPTGQRPNYSENDVLAGKRAGCKTVLIGEDNVDADLRVTSVLDFTEK